MKKTYSAPVMYREAYIAEQYIAASDCGTSVGVPDHGHFTNSAGETHCAFTASNCGENATSCRTTSGGACSSFNTSYHNCHILSNNTAAQSFVDTYSDNNCGNGVAALMGLGSFEEIETAFS